MKFRRIFILGLSLIFPSLIMGAAYVWTQKASYPGRGVAYGVATNIKSKIYYGTGETLGSVYHEWWEYNPAANSWARQADFPGDARMKANAFSIDPYGFVGAGQDDPGATNVYTDFWRYDAGANSWLQIAGLPQPQTSGVSWAYNDEGFVGLGSAPNGKALWKYDAASNAWIQVQNFPTLGVELAGSFAINGKAWVCCGNNGITGTSELWQYNITNNSWTQKSSFPGAPRWNVASFLLDGKGFCGLGMDNGALYNDFYSYDRFLNNWMVVDSFPGLTRIGTTAFSEGDFGYVLGGRDNGQYYNDLWSFGPPLDTGLTDSIPEFCIIDISPIATKGKLTLECDNVIDKTLGFNLYDLSGRLVYSQSVNMKTPILDLNISKYREGIYIYVIECNNLFVTSGKLALIQ